MYINTRPGKNARQQGTASGAKPSCQRRPGHVEPDAQNVATNDSIPQNVPEPQPKSANPQPVERRDIIVQTCKTRKMNDQDRGEGMPYGRLT